MSSKIFLDRTHAQVRRILIALAIAVIALVGGVHARSAYEGGLTGRVSSGAADSSHRTGIASGSVDGVRRNTPLARAVYAGPRHLPERFGYATEANLETGEGWLPMFVDVETALSGPVDATAIWDDGSGPAVYAAGNFTHAGHVRVNRVARWNGHRWVPLGSGVNGHVRALAVRGGVLIAAGDFTQAGGQTALRVAAWNGRVWTSLGTGLNDRVWALTGHGGELIAGGEFTAAGPTPVNRLARWNGSAWLPLGGGADGTVQALASDGSQIIAGGWFESAGGTPARHIARWNGSIWLPLGEGVTGGVQAVALNNGEVIAGGQLTAAGSMPAAGVARWDGSTWTPMSITPFGVVNALAVRNGAIMAAGFFLTPTRDSLATWNGSEWVPTGDVQSEARTLTVAGSTLVLGGNFVSAGGQAVSNITVWDGTAWASLGGGIDGPGPFSGGGIINALLLQDGLVAAGSFEQIGGVPARNIARWDGQRWSPLGQGLNGVVNAVTVHDGALVAAGDVTGVHPAGSYAVMRWDGASWEALGLGFSGRVFALVSYGGELVAAGEFATAGGSYTGSVARWDGSAWRPFGAGWLGRVRTLTVHDGFLIAGGDFTASVGGTAASVARWNGNTWESMNFPQSAQRVEALATHAAGLIAGSAGIPGISRWDGNGWPRLSGWVSARVMALASQQSTLFIGGTFENVGWTPASRLARWNGTAWSALGSGADWWVRALASAGTVLFVGGEFNTVDGQRSPSIAAWGPSANTMAIIQSTTPNPSVAGQLVTVTVRVSGHVAPVAGTVTIIGAPSGSCTSAVMVPIDATTSEARCTITFYRPGIQRLFARFDGSMAADGIGQAPSMSTDFEHPVGDGESLFGDGFEG